MLWSSYNTKIFRRLLGEGMVIETICEVNYIQYETNQQLTSRWWVSFNFVNVAVVATSVGIMFLRSPPPREVEFRGVQQQRAGKADLWLSHWTIELCVYLCNIGIYRNEKTGCAPCQVRKVSS